MIRILPAVFTLFTLHAQTIAPEGFRGSAVTANISPTPIRLSLQDAIDRGIRANIGLLVRSADFTEARAERMRALSALVPNVNAGISQYVAQNNLTTFGIRVPGFPSVVGPFSYFDARASVSSPVFDWTLMKRVKASTETARATQLSMDDGRDVVVAAVASGYFAILADVARVDVVRNQVDLARQLYQIAKDSHQAGTVPAIDELRAQVEFQKQQQLLLAAESQLAKDKLALARVIGIAGGQEFEVTDMAPYRALEDVSADNLLLRAYESRSDYKSMEARVRAAEFSREAAGAERLPTLSFDGNYGASGPTVGSSHGVFTMAGTLRFNIFDGGRIRAEQEIAGSVLQRRRDDLADVRGKIDFEVRNALLDLKTASDQVAIARVNQGLAQETITQARDRYVAGVGSGIELVEAEVSLAAVNQDVIAASFAHNLAKAQLARAVGAAQTALKQFIGDNK